MFECEFVAKNVDVETQCTLLGKNSKLVKFARLETKTQLVYETSIHFRINFAYALIIKIYNFWNLDENIGIQSGQ